MYNYCMYYLGTIDDAIDGRYVYSYMLPFDVVTFENMGGAYTEAVLGASCYVDVVVE